MRRSYWQVNYWIGLLVLALSLLSSSWASAREASAPAKVKGSTAAQKNSPQKASSKKTAAKKTASSSRNKNAARVSAKASGQGGRRSEVRRVAYRPADTRLSVGQQMGLHRVDDPLELRSSVALVVDQDTGQVLYEKNAHAVLPIASITKLMTALVVIEAGQNLDEILEISEADLDTEKGTSSRLRFGTRLSRAEALHLALMSSENRAASALGRYYPGGSSAFVHAMNAKAQLLGMSETHYADPTGLSSRNKSSAHDLARLMQVAYQYTLIREFSTSAGYTVLVNGRYQDFANTNRLIQHSDWLIGLQKTGFISEAGQCLVMQAVINGRSTIMVFLDAQGRLSRFGDANRIKDWLMTQQPGRLRSVTVSAKAEVS
ncbi:MAG: D-alanyl-D-alanine endopeptidase [Burkholderiales bacterium]|jgi:D-alanyl-D-alanine endopeptidase (penicillin-binding protein 7)